MNRRMKRRREKKIPFLGLSVILSELEVRFADFSALLVVINIPL